jgi:hypothetical protein
LPCRDALRGARETFSRRRHGWRESGPS